MTRSIYLAILLAIFEVGFCKKCYHCNAAFDKGCGTPFKAKDKLLDCSEEASTEFNRNNTYEMIGLNWVHSLGFIKYCHKIVMANHNIIRTCLSVRRRDRMLFACDLMIGDRRHPKRHKVKSCHVCEKDKCNAAGSLIFFRPLAVLLFLATYVL